MNKQTNTINKTSVKSPLLEDKKSVYQVDTLPADTPASEKPTQQAQPINSSETKLIKPLRKLTRKQQAFIQHIVDNPKASATQAAAEAYNVSTRHTAETIASENMRKPEIMAELAKYSNTAEITLVDVMSKSRDMMHSDSSRAVDWAVNARQTADSLLDRLHGKATQRIEAQSTSVTLNIDLSGNPSE